MNDKNKKQAGPKSAIPGLVVVAAIMLYNVFAANETEILIPIVAVLMVAAAIAITIVSAKKAAQNRQTAPAPAKKVELHRPFPTPEKHSAARPRPSALRHADEAEEAIRCDHVRGKQKYIRQLDSYLKNGIIDKAEYKILRERYEKLDIPDDYH